MSRIRIRDGLSPTGTPITTPRSQVTLGANLKLQSKDDYLIMVGRRLFDGDVARDDPATLVHEMTHVWQYMHGTLTQAGALAAHVAYTVGEELTSPIQLPGLPARKPLVEYSHLYSYEVGQSWNDMGFEGQAQMVEEWYSLDKMSETGDRWIYVKNVLMLNDRSARSLTLTELNTRYPPATAVERNGLSPSVAFEEIPFSDDYLLGVLRQAIQPNDVRALAARVKTLEDYCRQFRRVKLNDAVALAARLDAKKLNDKLAQAFHYRLSTPTRDRLLKILRGLA